MAKIEANDKVTETYRTGTLIGLTKEDLVEALGFEPNVDDDPDKVVNSWGFTVDGSDCAIWDYKGSHNIKVWSVYDLDKVLVKVFPLENFG